MTRDPRPTAPLDFERGGPTRQVIGRSAWAVCAAFTALVLVGLVTSGVAAEQQGAAIDTAHIDVDETLVPGERYELPDLGVRNPGTAETSFRMAAQPTDREEQSADNGWFSFGPDRFDLDPDAEQDVEVSMQVPADAPAGEYEVLLAAQVVVDGDGARVGGAAATRLTFAVDAAEEAGSTAPEEPSAAEQPPSDDRGWPWGGLLAGALVVAAVLVLMRVARRYEFRIERR